jgi:hypothetical protein
VAKGLGQRRGRFRVSTIGSYGGVLLKIWLVWRARLLSRTRLEFASNLNRHPRLLLLVLKGLFKSFVDFLFSVRDLLLKQRLKPSCKAVKQQLIFLRRSFLSCRSSYRQFRLKSLGKSDAALSKLRPEAELLEVTGGMEVLFLGSAYDEEVL